MVDTRARRVPHSSSSLSSIDTQRKPALAYLPSKHAERHKACARPIALDLICINLSNESKQMPADAKAVHRTRKPGFRDPSAENALSNRIQKPDISNVDADIFIKAASSFQRGLAACDLQSSNAYRMRFKPDCLGKSHPTRLKIRFRHST